MILETLRSRVLRGLQGGTLSVGSKLPSARTLAAEFDVDFRVILSAYRTLADEGLVEMRARGGVYVAAQAAIAHGMPTLPEGWISDVLTQALQREIPAPEFHEWLRRCTETLRLRVAVVASTDDQCYGLCRELAEDFGLEADGLTADRVRDVSPVPLSLRQADVIVTTKAHAEWITTLASDLNKPAIVIDVRPDLLGGEWALLLRQPVYAVVATEEFGRMLREFFASVPGVENLHVVVFGRDDLTSIPANAPTYVTQRVRTSLKGEKIPGKILPAARTIRSESAREIFAFIVRANISALAARTEKNAVARGD